MRIYFSRVRSRWLVAALLTTLVGLACSQSDESSIATQKPIPSQSAGPRLRNGLYPASRETSDPDSARLLQSRGPVLVFDGGAAGPAADVPQIYLAIDTTSMVPLVLEGSPEVRADGSGREILSVALTREYVPVLEDFTAQHLGERVAVVLDNKVVSVHKIRSVIREGRIQVSRCDSISCEILRSKLIE